MVVGLEMNSFSPPFLQIEVARKSYGTRQILKNLQLSVQQGEILSLIGASGCGKSTLLSIIAGLDGNFEGQISLDGSKLQGVSRDIGFIFQEPRLFPWLTVAQNIAFDSNDMHRDSAKLTKLLAEVGMHGYEHVLPKQLSGGQAQRVAIARGLFSSPKILLLDEPFSAVDAFTRMKLQDLLLNIASEYGLTIILVTHDIDEALYLSDRVVLMDQHAATSRQEFAVLQERPRNRAKASLSHLKADILESLHAAHAF
ncbi:sulfonate transport system ATP-binding protein [Undibacterium pigrum]|uniref:Sulfonate transport system ATP-binding protein n=2 Tax=Undibacterium pigrum TaxID=401470 RepID=A0A318IP80_9BURK|nr:sulfonate transport system ATP-binding protein [Undibacterium pigrum]